MGGVCERFDKMRVLREDDSRRGQARGDYGGKGEDGSLLEEAALRLLVSCAQLA